MKCFALSVLFHHYGFHHSNSSNITRVSSLKLRKNNLTIEGTVRVIDAPFHEQRINLDASTIDSVE